MANIFRGQWIGVKFYETIPDLPQADRPANMRFCEATHNAVLRPVLLDQGSITCPGARYVFGWESDIPNELINDCVVQHGVEESVLINLISKIPRLTNPISCIGLNTEKRPDLLLAYLLPKDVMKIVTIFMTESEKCLDVSLCSMMSVCGGVAVNAYLKKNITISFGCNDSRKFGHIEKNRLAVGIPLGLFDIFSKMANND